jgi:hypothetical protein
MQPVTDLLYDFISLIIIAIALFFILTSAIKSYKSYTRKKVTGTLFFAIAALCFSIAAVFLILEKLFLSLDFLADETLQKEILGMWVFGTIAVILSGVSIISIDAFALNMVFPKKWKIFSILTIIAMINYLSFFIFDPSKKVLEGEITHTWDPLGIGIPLTRLIVLASSIILLAIPVILFFYFTIKIRKKSKTRAKRSLTLGLACASFAVVYIIELWGIDPIITMIMRTLYIVAGIFFYYGLFGIKEKS